MMNWFSRKKKQPTLAAVPAEEALEQAAALVPAYFTNNSYYVAFVKNRAQQKTREAFMNLLTMEDTSGHLFSVDFWNSMEQCATAFNMKDIVEICREKRQQTITSKQNIPAGEAIKITPDAPEQV
ncbi:hypothetical protein KTO58_13260 [Chitinophaga pendula]|uniref:hypothetical protein n=1 Tax=Chitinophaga TaxID=79328 RepID=UPI000BAF05AA|nr:MULTISPECIES: hypothetical protein [Chitinophaga]ASZ12291.1 hypothetical protein CK934_15640 [Chitinophaga sp. MD30]UCJ10120.1 hypothetical protein KTO58_13260 [Chitinophaga pendula]